MLIHEMRTKRASTVARMKTINERADATATDIREFDRCLEDVKSLDGQLDRAVRVQEAESKAARPVGDGRYATSSSDPYEKDMSLSLGGMLRTLAKSKGNAAEAVDSAMAQYGENHPVTKAVVQSKALNTMSGTAGAFAVPADFVESIIPLLYSKTVVRRAGAITMPMPAGTMSFPKMTAGSTATWMGELAPIAASEPTFGQVVATAHKLAALVPVSNDQMRYANPQFDAQIRDDLILQIALAEDLAFVRGLETTFSPKGLKSIVLPGQTLTSTAAYTNSTVNNELGGLVNKLESANLPLTKVGWLMSPRTKNFLLNVLSSIGLYIYKDEMTSSKTLLGYPFYVTTAIPNNLTVNAVSNCSELYLVDFGQCMILESRSMEFAISTEGTYVDALGAQQSAFQNDLTLIRAIMAEDFQLRYDTAVAMDVGVTWAPALQ